MNIELNPKQIVKDAIIIIVTMSLSHYEIIFTDNKGIPLKDSWVEAIRDGYFDDDKKIFQITSEQGGLNALYTFKKKIKSFQKISKIKDDWDNGLSTGYL